MTVQKLLLCASVAAIRPLRAGADELHPRHHHRQIEPNAGQWRTWVISSGEDYRVPPPPSPSQTRAELRQLEDLVGHLDAATRQKIRFGTPGPRPTAGST